MKTLSILKKLITFYYYLAIFGFLFLVIGFPILFSTGKHDKLEFMDLNIDISDMSLGNFILIIIIGAFILFQFLKAIHLFKKSLNDLSNGNYFSELIVTNFKKIGQCFLIFGFGQWVYKITLRIVLHNDIKLVVGGSLFVLSILGLFFLFLSEVFAKARETKQENDLTI